MFDDLTLSYKVRRIGARNRVSMELTRAEAAAEVCVICGWHFPDAEAQGELLAAEVYGEYRQHGRPHLLIACTAHTANRLF